MAKSSLPELEMVNGKPFDAQHDPCAPSDAEWGVSDHQRSNERTTEQFLKRAHNAITTGQGPGPRSLYLEAVRGRGLEAK